MGILEVESSGGFLIWGDICSMKNMQKFIDTLYGVKEIASHEKCMISSGNNSMWETEQLDKIVLPEINELLSYALVGKVYFRYGKGVRLLESTYLLTDSIKDLNSTTLGKKIIELQKIYNSF